jgi:hypothetical protein
VNQSSVDALKGTLSDMDSASEAMGVAAATGPRLF